MQIFQLLNASRPPIRLQFPGQRIFNACQPTSSWAGGFSCPEKERGKLMLQSGIHNVCSAFLNKLFERLQDFIVL